MPILDDANKRAIDTWHEKEPLPRNHMILAFMAGAIFVCAAGFVLFGAA